LLRLQLLLNFSDSNEKRWIGEMDNSKNLVALRPGICKPSIRPCGHTIPTLYPILTLNIVSVLRPHGWVTKRVKFFRWK
jgi:hypothetical protein